MIVFVGDEVNLTVDAGFAEDEPIDGVPTTPVLLIDSIDPSS
jgi:hypothetical protein